MMVALRQPTSASLLPLCCWPAAVTSTRVSTGRWRPPADGAASPGRRRGRPGDGPLDQPRPDASRRRPSRPSRPTAPSRARRPTVGCADGTREGFADPAAWKHIAGCCGRLVACPACAAPTAAQPRCARAAGNTGDRRLGHGLRGRRSVRRRLARLPATARTCAATRPPNARAPSSRGHAAFFVTQAGASSYGLCAADPVLQNDLHGCGNFGQPELGGCQPLNRRLSFVDCLASRVAGRRLAGLVLRRRQPAPVRGHAWSPSPAPPWAACCAAAIVTEARRPSDATGKPPAKPGFFACSRDPG